MTDRKYMVVEDGFAVVLTKDRCGVSCWTDRKSAASMMTFDEADNIRRNCGFSTTALILGDHCTIDPIRIQLHN